MIENKLTQDMILKESNDGNLVIANIDGLFSVPLAHFIEQSVEGMLYDLNRSEAVALTFLDTDPKWINDYAVAKVIRALKNKIDKLEAEKIEYSYYCSLSLIERFTRLK